MEAEWRCLWWVGTDHSHIVFIRTSGQVYSMEAVEQMNIKIKSWNVRGTLAWLALALVSSHGLVVSAPSAGSYHGRPVHPQRHHQVCYTSTPPRPSHRWRLTVLSVGARGLVSCSIQDPNDMQKRNISEFHYVKEGLSLKEEEEEDASKNINAVGTTQKVLAELASVRSTPPRCCGRRTFSQLEPLMCAEERQEGARDACAQETKGGAHDHIHDHGGQRGPEAGRYGSARSEEVGRLLGLLHLRWLCPEGHRRRHPHQEDQEEGSTPDACTRTHT